MKTNGWTSIETVIVICIFFILAALFVPAMKQANNPADRYQQICVDGAPTVATVCIVPSTQRVYVSADVEQYELPPIGTELIARPAKDVQA